MLERKGSGWWCTPVGSWRLELLFAQMGKGAAGAGLGEGEDWVPGVGIALEGSVSYPRGPESRTPRR